MHIKGLKIIVGVTFTAAAASLGIASVRGAADTARFTDWRSAPDAPFVQWRADLPQDPRNPKDKLCQL